MNLLEAKKVMRDAGYSLLKEDTDKFNTTRYMQRMLKAFNKSASFKKAVGPQHTWCEAELQGKEIVITVHQKNPKYENNVNTLILKYEGNDKFALYDPEDDHYIQYYRPYAKFIDGETETQADTLGTTVHNILLDIDNYF